VFGIFFLPDMPAAIREAWRMVRPGGQLAITTWGSEVFEPANTIFWDAVRSERPDLHRAYNPWDRISEPATLRDLLRQGGIEDAEVVPETADHRLDSAGAWWRVVMGSGYRGTIEQMDPAARERIRRAVQAELTRRDVRGVGANVLYAVARR
jgi:cytochrome P450